MPNLTKYQFSIFIFFLLLFSQCQENTNELLNSCEFTTSSEIVVPTNTSITYKIHNVFDDDNIFIAYHYPTHSIDLIDLKSNTFLKKLNLDREGPFAIHQVQSVYVHNLDSIFLLTLNQIIAINSNGERLFEIKINRKNLDITGFDLDKYRIWCNAGHNQPIYYSAKQNSIYVGIKPYNAGVSLSNYELPIAGRISLESLEFEYLPIFYPDKFREGYFGVLDNPHTIFFDDYSIVAFGASYELYRFDNNDFSIQPFGIVSNYIKSSADMIMTDDPESAYQDAQSMQMYFRANPRTAKLRVNRHSKTLYNLYYASHNPDRLNYRTIGIFKLSNDGLACTKIDELEVEHEEYMTKMFFTTATMGLGLIDKTSTDDLLKLKYIKCGS